MTKLLRMLPAAFFGLTARGGLWYDIYVFRENF